MGTDFVEISKLLHLSYMTVSNIVKRILQSGSVENKARSGRPKVVTDRDYRKLERIVKGKRRDSLSDITSKFNEARGRRVRFISTSFLLIYSPAFMMNVSFIALFWTSFKLLK